VAAAGAGSVLTRIHGDYHLGHVLLVREDFVIVDFEGEPGRSLDERRRKQSPLKDVAGMLRSFDYAMHTAVERAVTKRPDLRDAAGPAAQRWQDEASAAFVDAYRSACAAAGQPQQGSAADELLAFFRLDKAIYELAYELDNRPDWIGIPLQGIVAMTADAGK